MRFWKTREFGTALVLLAMLLACEVAARLNAGTSFLFSPQLPRVFETSAFVGIAAIGACAVILTGGVDLSAGSVMTLGAVCLAWLLGPAGWPGPLALLGGLAAATAVGAVNGLLVAKLRMPPFIATLGFLSIARGFAFRTSGGLTIDVSSDASWIFTPLVGGAVATTLALAAAAGIFLARFRWGRYVYAIGGNEEAARYSGVPIDGVKIGVYAAAGFFAGLAGCAYALTHGTAYVALGNGYELRIIAACAIGGLSFSGGEGSVAGAVLGAATLEALRSLLIQLHVRPENVEIAYGAAIVLAVGVDLIRHRLGRKTA